MCIRFCDININENQCQNQLNVTNTHNKKTEYNVFVEVQRTNIYRTIINLKNCNSQRPRFSSPANDHPHHFFPSSTLFGRRIKPQENIIEEQSQTWYEKTLRLRRLSSKGRRKMLWEISLDAVSGAYPGSYSAKPWTWISETSARQNGSVAEIGSIDIRL